MHTSRRTVVIIHGAFGSPEENWFPWLKERVLEAGHTAIVPSFPTPEGQSPEAWDAVFARDVGSLTSDTILVGHSLGPAFILRLLERSPEPIRGTLLVSAFLGLLGLPAFDKINEPFVCRSFDWNRVSQNAGSIRMYSGDNDPYVPIQRGRDIATRLGAELSVVSGGGHINAEAGFLEFPQLLEDLKVLLA